MDKTLYLICSALLISIVVWLVNPFGKLHNLLSYLLRTDSGHGNLSEGVRSFDEMPGPKGLPYFGDVINFLKNSEFKEQIAALKNSFEKYGSIFKRTVMGTRMVFVQDPRDVEIVFKADGKYPVRPKDLVKVIEIYRKSRNLPLAVVTLDGEEWSRIRRTLAPKMLRPKDIRENLDNFNDVTRDAIDHMVAIRRADWTIPDLEGELTKYTTEGIGTMAFDVRVGLYDDPPKKETVKMVKATLDVFKYAGKLSRGLEGLLFRFVTTPTYWKYCKAEDTVIAVGQKIVDKKIMELKKMAEEGEAFAEDKAVPLLTYLIMKGELTPQEININAITSFRAGVDTIAPWCFRLGTNSDARCSVIRLPSSFRNYCYLFQLSFGTLRGLV